eukprot:gene8571-34005_t
MGYRTTVTAIITTGWLVTVANIGDSSAIVDTGSTVLELTRSHRIHTNVEEQERLKQGGCTIASLGFHLQGPAKPNEPGVGPLRVWPGGLCVSRSIGDHDAGQEVVPVPHIRQLMMPSSGSRLILGSDGLWDVLSQKAVAQQLKILTTKPAAASLMASVARDLRIQDDVTVIVVDILPNATTSFPSQQLRVAQLHHTLRMHDPAPVSAEPKASSSMFSCFKRNSHSNSPLDVEEGSLSQPSAPGGVQLLSDLDCLKVYPGLKDLINDAFARADAFSKACEAYCRPQSQSNMPLSNWSLSKSLEMVKRKSTGLSSEHDG